MLLVGVFQVLVDYSITSEDIYAAYKKAYEKRGGYFTGEGFLSGRKGTTPLSLMLIEFSDFEALSVEDVLSELDKKGLRAATATELLAFGERYSEGIGEFHVVALGSRFQGQRPSSVYLRLFMGDCPMLCRGDGMESIRYLVAIK